MSADVLTERETAELLRRCDGRSLHLQFGPGVVRLAPDEHWGRREIEAVRRLDAEASLYRATRQAERST